MVEKDQSELSLHVGAMNDCSALHQLYIMRVFHVISSCVMSQEGESSLSIAQQLGYISVVEILKQVTDVVVTTSSTSIQYKMYSPEMMQEVAMSDEDDEGQ